MYVLTSDSWQCLLLVCDGEPRQTCCLPARRCAAPKSPSGLRSVRISKPNCSGSGSRRASLLSVAGSALGLISAYWLKDGFKLLTGEVPFQTVIDWRVYVFTAVVAIGVWRTDGCCACTPARAARIFCLPLKGRSLHIIRR